MIRKSLLLLALLGLALPASAQDLAVEDAFSPRQGATDLILDVIAHAHSSIRVAAYTFTSFPIGRALVEAARKGIDVRVVLDKNQGRYSLAGFLQRNHVPTRVNSRYAIMHNKFMVVDGRTLELGSFNYTKSAEERNAENVLVLHDQPQIAHDYAKQWERLWSEAD